MRPAASTQPISGRLANETPAVHPQPITTQLCGLPLMAPWEPKTTSQSRKRLDPPAPGDTPSPGGTTESPPTNPRAHVSTTTDQGADGSRSETPAVHPQPITTQLCGLPLMAPWEPKTTSQSRKRLDPPAPGDTPSPDGTTESPPPTKPRAHVRTATDEGADGSRSETPAVHPQPITTQLCGLPLMAPWEPKTTSQSRKRLDPPAPGDTPSPGGTTESPPAHQTPCPRQNRD